MQERAYKQYIEDLEFEFLENLKKTKINPLLKSLKENKEKKHFSFISETNFTCLGKINLKADKNEKRVVKQKREYKNIIDTLNRFEGRPISEELAQRFYSLVVTDLFNPAIEYGYTEEACQLLSIIKNSDIVKDYAKKNADDKIIQLLSTFAKRVVLERTPDLEDQVDIFMIDVLTGEYGNDTKLSLDDMISVYENTEVKIGDTVCKVGEQPNYITQIYKTGENVL